MNYENEKKLKTIGRVLDFLKNKKLVDIKEVIINQGVQGLFDKHYQTFNLNSIKLDDLFWYFGEQQWD